MDQNYVKKLVGPCGRAIVMFLLITTATDEDIAQAANHERACFFRTRGFQQRQNLTRKLLSSKREELDEDSHRPQVIERHAKHLPAPIECALDGDSFVVTDKPICFVDAEWR